MCFCLPTKLGIEVDHIVRTPQGARKVVRKTTYGYTSPSRRSSLEKPYHSSSGGGGARHLMDGYGDSSPPPRYYDALMPPARPCLQIEGPPHIFDAHQPHIVDAHPPQVFGAGPPPFGALLPPPQRSAFMPPPGAGFGSHGEHFEPEFGGRGGHYEPEYGDRDGARFGAEFGGHAGRGGHRFEPEFHRAPSPPRARMPRGVRPRRAEGAVRYMNGQRRDSGGSWEERRGGGGGW